jgi:hypothetical protein
MNPLLIARTTETPRVDFNPQSGLLKIEGRSWPEDVTPFYNPLVQWFQDYVKTPAEQTDFYVTLEYFNSATSKMIYKLFMILTDVANNGSKVIIHWCYQDDDEEMLEMGEEYRAAIHCSSDLYEFKLVSIKDYPMM